MSYPEIFELDFYEKLLNKKEFHYFDKKSFFTKRQQFLKNYIDPDSPYERILLMHQVGTGKTLSSIAISEGFKKLVKKNKMKKTVIITKNDVIKDIFIKELSSECCDYEKEDIKKAIKKNYEFMTFGSLTNKVLGTKQPTGERIITGDGLSNLSDRIIIIDEFHNILGNEYYKAIQQLLDNSSNFRLVLLSATPFSDSIENLYQISNLLNHKSQHISEEEFGGLLEKKTIKNMLIKNEIISLTKRGEDVFSEKLKGKISYLGSSTKGFPRKNFKGEFLRGENSIKIFKDVMSEYQTEKYSDIIRMEKQDPLYKMASYESTYADPYDKNDLKLHSSKLYSIVNEIKKSEGPVFVYSNSVQQKGVKLVSKVLTDNKISNRALSKDVKKEKRRSILKSFNSPENINGEKIKVLIGSPVLSEGITLKNVRQVHILEPYWNMSKIDQVVGRAVRRGSHSLLPPNKRSVDIYLHAAIPLGKKERSVDSDKYLLSYFKDIAIKKTERLLKKIAIDCAINTKPGNRDYSRECDYDKCDYNCNYIWSAPIKLDKSTFYKTEKSDKKVNKLILELFDSKYILSFKNIKKILKDVRNEEIAKSLNDIITLKLATPNQRTIIYKNGLYISVKNKVNSDLVPEILFLDAFEDDTFNKKSLEEYNSKKESPKKQKASSSNIKFSSKSSSSPRPESNIEKQPIYGTFKDKFGNIDKKFRIVLNIMNKKIKKDDKREIIKGKVCTSFSKKELSDILKKYFDTIIENPRFTSKEDMCSEIYKRLKNAKLIIKN